MEGQLHRPLTYWTDAQACCNPLWEQAYRRFETPPQERAKFRRRLQYFAVNTWSRDWMMADLFCGRGNLLQTLEALGFHNLHGVDLSAELLHSYSGNAQLYVGDCRDLRFADASLDRVIIQGGLHHLPSLTENLPATLREIARVLKPEGRLVLVEPWRDRFLQTVHFFSLRTPLRRLWPKLDAFATMTRQESPTYWPWLDTADWILQQLHAAFTVERQRIHFGKLYFEGRPLQPTEVQP